MEFCYIPPPYTKSTGLKREWELNFSIAVRVSGNEVTVRANRAGLMSLAKQLITLAQSDVPIGTHLHFDAGTALEDDSAGLVISLAQDT